MSTDNKYNGWTNYATWRINLEIFDGFELKDHYSDKPELSEVADYIQEYLEDALETESMGNNLVLSYALAFVNQVNYREIAEHLIEAAEYEEDELEDEDA